MLATPQQQYVPLTQQTYRDLSEDEAADFVNQPVANYNEEKCPDCFCTTVVEDSKMGDIICSGCGLVKEARSVSPEAEYRCFADDEDSQTKVRVGASYNPFLPINQLGSKRKQEQDEYDFLWEGERNIKEVLGRLLGDGENKPVENRAIQLWQKAFQWQLLQKKGIESQVIDATKPETKINKKMKKMSHARKKYSRRKQFVVACLVRAMKENSLGHFSVEDVDRLIDGKTVSRNSVKRCLKDLNLL